MKADICEVIVYTQSGAIPFEIIVTADDFEERLAAALEQGTVILNTADGCKVVLCAINVVAIEIHKTKTRQDKAEKASDTPPL